MDTDAAYAPRGVLRRVAWVCGELRGVKKWHLFNGLDIGFEGVFNGRIRNDDEYSARAWDRIGLIGPM